MPKGTKGKTGMRLDLWIAIPQVKVLRALSKKTGLTMSDIVRRALDKLFAEYGESGKKGKR